MKNVIFTIIICFVISCQNNKCNCEVTNELLVKNDSLITSIFKMLDNSWERYDEPLIHKTEIESYRFSTRPSLRNYIKTYRIEKLENQYNLFINKYHRKRNQDKDSLVSNLSNKITKNQWTKITNAFNENCFWTMPVDVEENYSIADGSLWLLEGMKLKNHCTNNSFHFVIRNSPDETTGFHSISNEFFELDSLYNKK